MSSLSKKKLCKNKIAPFQSFIWGFYKTFGRSFTWRNTDNPYHVVVSEIMLQQTQTHRVTQKYEQFTDEFPHFESLAQASLRDVLSLWQGLGYNRRAQYLQKTAQKVVHEYNGQLPDNPAELETFPGIGKYTAGSICAFAFNKPTVFVETNIRTVYIYSFLPKAHTVSDNELLPLVAATVDHNNPREWYYALMDYGAWLKKKHVNPTRKSSHYTRQSKFEGSDRQIRGRIIKILIEQNFMMENQLVNILDKDKDCVVKILQQLDSEGLIQKTKKGFSII